MKELVMNWEKMLDPLAQKSFFAKREKKLMDEEDYAALRSPFGRDCDRILYSKSFRRLIHKTQVYISDANEHNRTRLTHTLEVARIAKVICRNLFMNEELAEAIALGHDVGHAPFGHAGERQINRFLLGQEPFPTRVADKMEVKIRLPEDKKSGFKHNYQSIRVFTFLEKYHPSYDGLNLTIQTLEGILKHTKIGFPTEDFHFPGLNDKKGIFSKLDLNNKFSVTIEGQIAGIADEVAQVTHDTNDALGIGELSVADLFNSKHIKKVIFNDKMRYPKNAFKKCKNHQNREHCQIMSALLNHFIDFIIKEFRKKIAEISSRERISNSEPFKLKEWLLTPKEEKNDEPYINDQAFQDLKIIKNDLVLNNFFVNRMDSKGEYFIRNLFEAYLSNPRQLTDFSLDSYCLVKKKELKKLGEKGFVNWLENKRKNYRVSDYLTEKEISLIISFLDQETDGREFRLLPSALIDKMIPYLAIDSDFMRTIADQISSMTDIFARHEYGRLYN